ncbi:rhamnogalacturonan lyase [Niabella terrae]
MSKYILLLIGLHMAVALTAQRFMERLDRGVVAVPDTRGNILVSWRLLGTEPAGKAFDLYKKVRGQVRKLNQEPIRSATCFLDRPADTTVLPTYIVTGAGEKPEQTAANSYTLQQQKTPYHRIALQIPEGYTANDGSVGDLDGDGQYEIILHVAGKGHDNSHSGFTDPPLIQAYKLDGTLLWTINLGENIREGAHYTQFIVYDLDSDGRAELALKTADGTRDGNGRVIGDSSRHWRNPLGHILAGPEYLTIFDGRSGAALHTVNYIPPRSTSSLEPDAAELKKIWGDGRGNRSDRYLAAVAYLDGIHPSLIMCRGYYTRTVIAAWDFKGKKLRSRWVFDSDQPGNAAYAGQGNHNLSIADVDQDGRDEIVYGSMCIDDNGRGLYSTGLGHGDAMHVSDLDPSIPGLEVFAIQERFDDAGASFRSAATGKIYWKKPSVKAGADGEGPGRGLSLDIDPRYPGNENWVAGAGITGLFDAKGHQIADRTPACNMGIYWDGDLLREVLNGTRVDKWDYQNSRSTPLLNTAAYGCLSNNGSKANPVLAADIWGDWREELIYRSRDNRELRIFTSPLPDTHKIYTLMHDPQYRLGIVWQNVAYNQPAHTSFFLGAGIKTLPVPRIRYPDTRRQN